MTRTHILWFLLSLATFTLVNCSNTSLEPEEEPEEEKTELPEGGSELPKAIEAYQLGAQSEDIEQYMEAFADDISILDVRREIIGRDNVRRWALNEVVNNGSTFNHIEIIEQMGRYAQTEVNWLSFRAHYYYWWNEEGQITHMSLQYTNSDNNGHSIALEPGVRSYFNAVENEVLDASLSGFADNITVNIAGMRFNGLEETRSFIDRDVIGGTYTLEKVFNEGEEQVVYCLFQPEGWSSPEPPIEYRFTMEDDKVIKWTGKYRD